MENQEIIFGIIVNSGNARSNSLKALKLAKKGSIKEARQCIREAGDDLNKAHEIQTALIQNEAAGRKIEISLLMIHAQDHLMNAITIKDLACEIIDIQEKLI